MRNLILIFSLLIINLVPFISNGQIVSDKTNQVKLDFKGEEVNTTLPEIVWQYPKLRYTNSKENKVKLQAKITSKVPLTSVNLVARSSTQGDTLGKKNIPIKNSPLNVTLDQTMYLPEGENFLDIIATNQKGGTVKDFRSVIVGMDAMEDAVAIDRQDHALLFAADKYNNWNDLANPIFDAESIGKELKEQYGFNVEIVKNYSQEEVFTKLREYAQKSYKPQDQLFIFFAGHGQFDETFGEGYVVAQNSLANDPSKNSYISFNRLRSIINNIPVNHIFLAMDVCYGGTFDQELASSRGQQIEDIDNAEFIVDKLSMNTRKYLTSGSKEYVSDGIAGQHSPFARKFLEGLKTNGGEDRILTLAELKVQMQRLPTTPRFGGFGIDEQGSEFLFISQN